MARPDPSAVRRIACVGAGTIGGAWAAYFLGRGYDVVAWDPDEDIRVRLPDALGTAWRAVERMGLAPGASRDRLTVAPTLGAAVAEAEFVQESAPERLPLKIELLAEIDALSPRDIFIASSTSSYKMTDMQVRCARPERFVVGHPFNPVYLLPLVEVVGGAATDPAAVCWAQAFYEAAGKSVLKLDREVFAFVANRLQAALSREALHMIAAGEATLAQIDQSIAEGPGLRWAIMGPMLDQFGPALETPMSRLEAPPLTPELRAALIDDSAREAGGRSIDALERERDDCLIEIMKLLAAYRADRAA